MSSSIKSPCNIGFSHVTDSCVVVDGNYGSGHFVCQQAAKTGMLIADRQGIAAVAIRNSNYCGALGYYTWLLAEQGYLSFIWSNSHGAAESIGGGQPFVGANPMAFGAPNESGEHLLIETASTAGTRTAKLHAAAGDPPIVSPNRSATELALALIGETLCGVIASAEFSFDMRTTESGVSQSARNGQFMLILDPRAFSSSARYGARFGQLFDALSEHRDTIETPGSARHAARSASASSGVELSDDAERILQRACERVGVGYPGNGLRAHGALSTAESPQRHE